MTSNCSSQQPEILTLEQVLQQGIACHRAGRLQEAEHFYRAIIQVQPNHSEANHNLGVLAIQVKQPEGGLLHFKAALEANPHQGQYWISYIDALIQAGHQEAARDVLEQGKHRGLQGEPVEVLAQRLLASSQMPAPPLVAVNTSQASMHDVTSSLCVGPDTHTLDRLMAIFNAGRYSEAETFAREITLRFPQFGVGWRALGSVLHRQGRLREALNAKQMAAKLLPEDAGAHYDLGNTLKDLCSLGEAEISYLRALEINPKFAEAYNNLGIVMVDLARFNEAVTCYRQAVEIKSDFVVAYKNLSIPLTTVGRLDEAAACCRRALELKPDFSEVHSYLIFIMDMAATSDFYELQRERERWDASHAALFQSPLAHCNDRSPDRRLRVGYVSADFKNHSAAKAFGGMLTRYDRSQFDVYAYSALIGKEDRITNLFKHNVTVWRDIGSVSDNEVAKLIREDRIDVLVDLSGHSLGNRLLVFARKPAPIQITAWGYATGTGLRAMDVFFADPVMVPPHEKRYFSEEVRYLPGVASLFVTDRFPDVNELPALADGIVTFGSFNRLAKVTENTYRAWAEVLLAVPRSRLLLKTPELEDASTRERMVEYFIRAGVAAERIVMQGKSSWFEHMQAYRLIDIALDPFPHGGGVTTMEGLMMGVPVITLRWPTIAGRVSASIMMSVGLTDWIAETQERYIELAVQKAADLQSLGALRQLLRGIFAASAVGDHAGYVRAVEKEYRQLWREWCSI